MTERGLPERLKEQIEYLYTLDFYRKKMDSAGLRPEGIRSLEDFERIPFTDRREFVMEMNRKDPPYGSFSPEGVVRINFTPSGDYLMPVFHTANDLEFMHQVCHRSLKAASVTSQDICAVAFGYHLFMAGLFYQGQLETYGAKVIPLGPGQTAGAVEIINRHGVTVLIGNPSYALRLASSGMNPVRVLIAGGEPLTSVSGYRDRIRQAIGEDLIIIDSYSMSECMPIARSCALEGGLHVMDEFVYAEIVDPETGQPLEQGQIGELILTHLKKEAQPLLRFRTGDLTMLTTGSCKCGRFLTMAKGVLGRTDEMWKVKGVKLYPSQVKGVIENLGLSPPDFRLRIYSDRGSDRLAITIKSVSAHRPDLEEIRQALRDATLLSFDEIHFDEHLGEGPQVIDERKLGIEDKS